jgi:hypothetical protein
MLKNSKYICDELILASVCHENYGKIEYPKAAGQKWKFPVDCGNPLLYIVRGF